MAQRRPPYWKQRRGEEEKKKRGNEMVERRGNEPVIERNGAKIAGPDTLGQTKGASVCPN